MYPCQKIFAMKMLLWKINIKIVKKIIAIEKGCKKVVSITINVSRLFLNMLLSSINENLIRQV